MKKKIWYCVKFISIVSVCFFCVAGYIANEKKDFKFQLDYRGKKAETAQIFFDTQGTKEWNEEDSIDFIVDEIDQWYRIETILPENIKCLRIDFDSVNKKNEDSIYEVRNLAFDKKKMLILDNDEIIEKSIHLNQLNFEKQEDGSLNYISDGEDPFIILDVSDYYDQVKDASPTSYLYALLIAFVIWIFLRKVNFSFKNVKQVVKELVENKNLIMKLGYNDFKTKYASSYLGIIWGFINPFITILVYWFVFQVAFKSGDVDDTPFILWFLCGIVPWFYFSEAMNSATNSFIEYSYLVKKVKFKIDILPFIKIISSLFVHIFFVAFVFIVMALYGYYPDIYNLQVLYYIFCMIVLVYAVTLFSSSVVLFFRDLGQIISIILNVGFWFTPIGWNIAIIPTSYQLFLKMNPMFYVVQGFRDSFVADHFFWERPYQTVYFWFFIVVMFSIGIAMFKKLRPHFADVL